jgi:hypothetical protein
MCRIEDFAAICSPSALDSTVRHFCPFFLICLLTPPQAAGLALAVAFRKRRHGKSVRGGEGLP